MDYDLTRLGPREFEHLTQALAVKILGTGVSVFGDGRDGGREAAFSGRMRFPEPDPGGPWNGYGVLQAKFRTRPLGTSADTGWFLREVDRELAAWGNPNSSRARHGRLPDYMILATNVVLSSVTGSGGIDRVETEIKKLVAKHRLPLKGWKIWHFEQIRTFLDLHPEIRQTYDAMVTPADVLARLRRSIDTRSIPRASVRFTPGPGGGSLVTDDVSGNMTDRLGLHHSIHSTPMGVSLVGGRPDWLVKPQNVRSDPTRLRIEKLAEARWLRELRTSDECAREVGSRVREQLAGFTHILVLRVAEAPPTLAYQLCEVPRDLLVERIAAANARTFRQVNTGFVGDFSHRNGDWLFRLNLDKPTEKIRVGYALEHAIDHGTWTVTLPSPRTLPDA
ncbi:hypothetical protein [Streptomyces tagetis]|uniref:Uncharacterized protein n=1 Tax=Streptomyces tagetis TaxID=2820809 RepID=A0A940XHK1_9ACTN|nr:hypothetical protein [Streptomyces sp. RG38]MBQ0828544.1 hypothetical protein [Streptomyces sp. RG38]